jgi:hypothetical protein
MQFGYSTSLDRASGTGLAGKDPLSRVMAPQKSEVFMDLAVILATHWFRHGLMQTQIPIRLDTSAVKEMQR